MHVRTPRICQRGEQAQCHADDPHIAICGGRYLEREFFQRDFQDTPLSTPNTISHLGSASLLSCRHSSDILNPLSCRIRAVFATLAVPQQASHSDEPSRELPGFVEGMDRHGNKMRTSWVNVALLDFRFLGPLSGASQSLSRSSNVSRQYAPSRRAVADGYMRSLPPQRRAER